jgi:hypothetical protein
MVSKTKTKTRKKGKQTKGSKKSKVSLKRRSNGKKPTAKRKSKTIARPKRASSKRKRVTTASMTNSTTGPFEQQTKSLTNKGDTPNSIDETAAAVAGEDQLESGASATNIHSENTSSYAQEEDDDGIGNNSKSDHVI